MANKDKGKRGAQHWSEQAASIKNVVGVGAARFDGTCGWIEKQIERVKGTVIKVLRGIIAPGVKPCYGCRGGGAGWQGFSQLAP